jgi:hypothetical protein
VSKPTPSAFGETHLHSLERKLSPNHGFNLNKPVPVKLEGMFSGDTSCICAGKGVCLYCYQASHLVLSIDPSTLLYKCTVCSATYGGVLFPASRFSSHCLNTKTGGFEKHMKGLLETLGMDKVLPTLRVPLLKWVDRNASSNATYERVTKQYPREGISIPIEGIGVHDGLMCLETDCLYILSATNRRGCKKHHQQDHSSVADMKPWIPTQFQCLFRDNAGNPIFCRITNSSPPSDPSLAGTILPTSATDSLEETLKRLMNTINKQATKVDDYPQWFLDQKFHEIPDIVGLPSAKIYRLMEIPNSNIMHFGGNLSDTLDGVILAMRSIILAFYHELNKWLDGFLPGTLTRLLQQ